MFFSRLALRHVHLFSGKVGLQGNGKKIRYFRMQKLNCNQSNMSNLKTSGKTRSYIILPVEMKFSKTTLLHQKKTFAQDTWDREDQVFKRKVNQFCINHLSKLQKYNLQKDHGIAIRRHSDYMLISPFKKKSQKDGMVLL